MNTINCLPPQQDVIDQLQDENNKLKQIVANLERHREALQLLLDERTFTPSVKRRLTKEIQAKYGVSLRHACSLLLLARSTCWYTPQDDEVVAAPAAAESGADKTPDAAAKPAHFPAVQPAAITPVPQTQAANVTETQMETQMVSDLTFNPSETLT